MVIRAFQDKIPHISPTAYVDKTALVIGDVTIEENSSVWPMTVIRGDVHSIRIGKRTNIQDGSVLHVTHDGEFSPEGLPLIVGDDVTVGHRVILHACTVGNFCLIGMSATIMDEAILGDNIIIGANSLVPGGRQLKSGHLYMGSPVKCVRELNQKELRFLNYSAKHYVQLKQAHNSR